MVFGIDEAKSLGTMPHLAQEYTLIEDILYVMMSIDGTYIKRKQDPLNKSKFKYVIEPHLESPSSGTINNLWQIRL